MVRYTPSTDRQNDTVDRLTDGRVTMKAHGTSSSRRLRLQEVISVKLSQQQVISACAAQTVY